MDALMNASEAELQEVNEVGPRIAESMVEFFQEPKNRELIEQLRKAGVAFTGKKRERGTALAGKTFVLTGTLHNLTRDEAKKMIEDAGGTPVTAFETAEACEDPVEVRGYLTFVIVGGGPTGVETASEGRLGKSMTYPVSIRLTVRGPLAEWKTTALRPGSSRSMTAAALARVAWPQRGTSVVGVNQRSR
jgi:NADPH-dependent 2,4-dienoyl-CoA reductase/sulfur reductase-like enzyme